MRRPVWFPALAGILLVSVPASWGQVGGPMPPFPSTSPPAPVRTPVPVAYPPAGYSMPAPAVYPSAPVASGHHRPGCGHDECCSVPCSQFLKYETRPLPPITLSRYADDGDYDCVKRVYGDAYPHCPRYWFNDQPYAAPHDYQARGGNGNGKGEGGGGGAESDSEGPSGGRGVGVGGRGAEGPREFPSQRGGRGVGVTPGGPSESEFPGPRGGGRGVGVGGQGDNNQ